MNELKRNRHVFILTGPVQGGKTTSVSDLVIQWRNRGLKVMGFLCPGTLSEGRRSAFHLLDIETGQQMPMGSEEEQPGWEKFRRFFINPDAFVRGEQWIRDSIHQDPDLLVIDELGPLELEGLGWSGLLDFLASKTSIKQLWIVREQILPEAIHKWNLDEHHIYRKDTLERLKQLWMP